eukprot:15443998-Alexandrium_andersonii.AAC.1
MQPPCGGRLPRGRTCSPSPFGTGPAGPVARPLAATRLCLRAVAGRRVAAPVGPSRGLWPLRGWGGGETH